VGLRELGEHERQEIIVSEVPLVKLRAASAAEICGQFNLRKEARPLLRAGLTPREFVEALVREKQYIAGIEFIAHALPPREAIWWGGLCVQHACGVNLSPAERRVYRAAVQWVLEPTEVNRSAAKAPVGAVPSGSPAGWLAVAAEQAGSVAGSKAAPTPPAPFTSAEAVSIAVKLASVKGGPPKIADTQRLFVELGMGVAEGRFAWPDVEKERQRAKRT
jgi:uncharacterized protein DUF6931